MKFVSRLLAGAAVCLALGAPTQAAELNKIGISVGLLGNPFFVATIKGIEAKAREINPDVEVTALSADYDLNKQVSQIDTFISAGVDIIMINPVDAVALAPAIKKAKAAGVTVAAFDVSAPGVDVEVMTDNVKAGALACGYIAEHIGGEGKVVLITGPQVTAVIGRMKGCHEELAKYPDIEILSDDQNGKGSREGGLEVMQGLLTKYPHIDGVFGVNDPTALGAALAAKQLRRDEFIITGVDGAPDVEKALADENSLIKASASQDPFHMAALALEMGYAAFNGETIEQTTVLLAPELITAENLDSYQGWNAAR